MLYFPDYVSVKSESAWANLEQKRGQSLFATDTGCT